MIRNEKDRHDRKERRITSAVLSLVIAFGLWWYVVNNVSMEDDITFNNRLKFNAFKDNVTN